MYEGNTFSPYFLHSHHGQQSTYTTYKGHKIIQACPFFFFLLHLLVQLDALQAWCFACKEPLHACFYFDRAMCNCSNLGMPLSACIYLLFFILQVVIFAKNFDKRFWSTLTSMKTVFVRSHLAHVVLCAFCIASPGSECAFY